MIAAIHNFVDNPVLVHEMRARMRGVRAYWILFGYLSVVAATLVFCALNAMLHRSHNAIEFSSAGSYLFGGVICAQAILIALIAPAVSCGAFTLERERQTYEMLAASRMGGLALVRGKLAASLSFLLLCLVCSLPLIVAITAFGGVAPEQAIDAYALLILEAAISGAIGVFWSSLLRSTIAATALAFVSVIGASFATIFCGAAALDVTMTNHAAHPGEGVAALCSLSPYFAGFVGPYGVPFFSLRIPYWLPGVLIGPLVVGLLIALAVSRLPQITQSRRTGSLPLATAILALVTLFLAGGFFSPADPSHSSSVNLWSCLLGILACAVPFLMPRKSDGSMQLRLPDAARMIVIAAGWIALCGGIAAAAAHWGSANPDSISVTGACFLLTISFLAAEIGLGMAVIRWTRSHLAAVLVPLVGAGGITLLPLLAGAAPTGSGAWIWLYLSPAATLNALANSPIGATQAQVIKGAAQNTGAWSAHYPLDLMPQGIKTDGLPPLLFHQSWHITATELYAVAAVIFFLLAMIPYKRHGRRSC